MIARWLKAKTRVQSVTVNFVHFFFNSVKGVQDCEEKKKISASLETVGNRKKNVIF